jgi:hypothetical protein
MKVRNSDKQIIAIMKVKEAGGKAADVRRRHRMISAMYSI